MNCTILEHGYVGDTPSGAQRSIDFGECNCGADLITDDYIEFTGGAINHGSEMITGEVVDSGD